MYFAKFMEKSDMTIKISHLYHNSMIECYKFFLIYKTEIKNQQKLYNKITFLKKMQQKQNPTNDKQNITHIATMVRIRPLLDSQKDQRQSIKCIDNKTLEIKMSAEKRNEQVERVFGVACTQRDIFQDVKPFISRCAEGFNVTIFTYGQTGSGKTYTMFGSDWNNILKTHTNQKSKQSTFLRSIQQDQNHAGLIPRAINHIFNNLINKRRKFIKVYCSFLQLYNQSMMDLFEDDKQKLDKKMLIHQNKNDGIYVEGLNQIEVADVDHCLQLMQKGQKNRIVRQTSMNVKSSRSHTLFQLLIQEVFPSNKSFRRMKINLCDLAGSQKINKAENMEQEHFDQLKNINLSLTTLGKVIGSLSEKNLKPPFRQSKLTRLLQDSLGGNTYTAIIATITSKSSCLDESINTLKFLERAKQVKSTVSNKIFNDNPEMRNLEKQIAYLKDVLKMKRTGVQVDIDLAHRVKKLQSQNQKLKEMVNSQLVQKLMKENTHLKRELDRKTNDELLQSRHNFTTLEPSTHPEITNRQQRQKSVIQKSSDVVSSSYSTNKGIITKQRRFMSTKTYTSNNGERSNNSTNKSRDNLFPSIRSIGSKNAPSSILERIHEIQRVKQANRLKLEHELSMIGNEKKSKFIHSSNGRYQKNS